VAHFSLIVGLGNVGAEYDNTRHNVGFRILDQIANRYSGTFRKKKDLKGEISRFVVADATVTLLKPTTYMNLSGEAVRKTIDFFKVSTSSLLVITDDVDLPLGEIRLRSSGSSGGHNGLKSIEEQLASKDYYRLKIGVGRKVGVPLVDFVLGKFEPEEEKILKAVIDRAEGTVMAFVSNGYQGALDHLAKLRSQNKNTHSIES